MQGAPCTSFGQCLTPLDVSGSLDAGFIACEWRHQCHIQWEGEVDQTKTDNDTVTHQCGLGNIALGYKDRDHLLPPEDSVGHEDEDRENIEEAPEGILENLEFEGIDVADADLLNVRVLRPEQVQRQDTLKVHKVWRWADEVFAKLVCVTKAELEEVNRHEGHKHEAGDGQIQDAETRAAHKLQLHVPSALESNHGMQGNGQDNVLLHNIGGQSESCPVQAHVEVTISIEVIGSLEHMEVAHGMDDEEDEQEDGAASQAHAVVGYLDVCRREDGGTCLVQHRQE
mmetsp:Transcript_11834/g.15998  ORF Transcript_11834/g.15998 Transcript_11834/m.15998 type:complete len:284 (-) Transcript_11834:413-1264(-)